MPKTKHDIGFRVFTEKMPEIWPASFPLLWQRCPADRGEFFIKIFGPAPYQGGCCHFPLIKVWEKYLWKISGADHGRHGEMGPIPGFVFRGRKSFRLEGRLCRDQLDLVGLSFSTIARTQEIPTAIVWRGVARLQHHTVTGLG